MSSQDPGGLAWALMFEYMFVKNAPFLVIKKLRRNINGNLDTIAILATTTLAATTRRKIIYGK
jgi:hypothetical protein